MITLMQKVQAYFAKRGQLRYNQWIIKKLHKDCQKAMKKLVTVRMERTFPDGRKEITITKLHKVQITIPSPYVQEYRGKREVLLTDGSVLTVKKEPEEIHGFSFQATMEDEL